MIRKLLPVAALAVLAQVGLTTPAHASPVYARVNVVIKSGSDAGGKYYLVCADGHAATLVTTGGQWSFQVDVTRGSTTTSTQYARSGVADYTQCSAKLYRGSSKSGEVHGLLNYSNVDLDIAGTGANSKPWSDLGTATVDLDGIGDDGAGTGILP
jgi:hypothetical protein